MDTILVSSCLSTGKWVNNYRWVLQENKDKPLNSILKVERQFKGTGEFNCVGGGWYVGTLLNKDGYYGTGQSTDIACIDGGSQWNVCGLLEALEEVKIILKID